jgi:hypothetical protein
MLICKDLYKGNKLQAVEKSDELLVITLDVDLIDAAFHIVSFGNRVQKSSGDYD